MRLVEVWISEKREGDHVVVLIVGDVGDGGWISERQKRTARLYQSGSTSTELVTSTYNSISVT